MPEPLYSNAALRDANRVAASNYGSVELALVAEAIRAAQLRIRNDFDNPTGEQLRGVRRAAAHIADALDNDKLAISFLIACGYGAQA